MLILWLREIGLDHLSMLLFLIPVAYALTKYIGDRPNQLSYLFSILSFYLLFQVGKGRKRGLLLIPVMLLWANIHGGFLLGMVLISLTMAYDIIVAIYNKKKRLPDTGFKRRILLYSLSLLSCAVTPNG